MIRREKSMKVMAIDENNLWVSGSYTRKLRYHFNRDSTHHCVKASTKEATEELQCCCLHASTPRFNQRSLSRGTPLPTLRLLYLIMTRQLHGSSNSVIGCQGENSWFCTHAAHQRIKELHHQTHRHTILYVNEDFNKPHLRHGPNCCSPRVLEGCFPF